MRIFKQLIPVNILNKYTEFKIHDINILYFKK